MDQHRRLILAAGGAVLQSELLGQLHIELDRAALVIAADGVLDQHVNLRRVERSIALLHGILEALLQNRLQRGFRLGPLSGLPDGLRLRGADGQHVLGLRGEHEGVAEAQTGVHVLDDGQQLADLRRDLVLAAEDVPVVLRLTSHARGYLVEHVQPRESAQRTRVLLPVDGGELGVAQREVAVGARLRLVHEAVRGAVHGLEEHLLRPAGLHVEHVLLVVVVVAADAPEVRPEHQR